jgi:hypothetical protein
LYWNIPLTFEPEQEIIKSTELVSIFNPSASSGLDDEEPSKTKESSIWCCLAPKSKKKYETNNIEVKTKPVN